VNGETGENIIDHSPFTIHHITEKPTINIQKNQNDIQNQIVVQ